MSYEVSGHRPQGYLNSANGVFGIFHAIAHRCKSMFVRTPLKADLRHQPSNLAPPLLGADNLAGLSRCEFRVCMLLSQLVSLEVVEAKMGLSRATFRLHLRNICQKTGCQSVSELTHRLLEPASRMNDRAQAQRLLASAPPVTDWAIAQRLRA